MPKRPNPFGEGSPLQLKQHIGNKEIDMGIAQEENMKRVYGKDFHSAQSFDLKTERIQF